MEQRYVRMPGPGEMRGQGLWLAFTGCKEDWDYLIKTGYLPIGWKADGPTDDTIFKDGYAVRATKDVQYDREQIETLVAEIGGPFGAVVRDLKAGNNIIVVSSDAMRAGEDMRRFMDTYGSSLGLIFHSARFMLTTPDGNVIRFTSMHTDIDTLRGLSAVVQFMPDVRGTDPKWGRWHEFARLNERHRK